jgi:hypothetical protein
MFTTRRIPLGTWLVSSNRIYFDVLLSLLSISPLIYCLFNFTDVIGVVTSVVHDKNFYRNGRVTQSVTFKLNDPWFVFFI